MSAKDEHVGEDRPGVRDQFQRAHSAHHTSPVLLRIWRNAYGEDFPEDVNPTAFYSRSVLLRLQAGLQIDAGGTIVDLGCGNGGAGLWTARRLGTKLIGIDLSAVGVATASKRAAELGLSDRVHFQEGDITATGLSSHRATAQSALTYSPSFPTRRRRSKKSRGSFVLARGSRSRPGNRKATRRASMPRNLLITDPHS
jgi:SAM-dependent methyltransferase